MPPVGRVNGACCAAELDPCLRIGLRPAPASETLVFGPCFWLWLKRCRRQRIHCARFAATTARLDGFNAIVQISVTVENPPFKLFPGQPISSFCKSEAVSGFSTINCAVRFAIVAMFQLTVMVPMRFRVTGCELMLPSPP